VIEEAVLTRRVPGLTPFHGPMQLQKNSSKARTTYLLAVAEGRGAGHLRTDRAKAPIVRMHGSGHSLDSL